MRRRRRMCRCRCLAAFSASILLLFILLIVPLYLVFWDPIIAGRAAPRIKRSSDLPLRFRYDGTFKILQVADMHFGNGAATRCRDVLSSDGARCSDLNTTRFLRELIQAERPDLIVFTGDNIFGSSATDAAESMFKAFSPAMDSGTPWAAILGNHDQESTMTREELMSLISLMDYSVSRVNPDGPTGIVHGFGNYDVSVNGALGARLANTSVLNLYFLDSGDREVVGGVRTYGWIRESQLAWLRTTSRGFQIVEKYVKSSAVKSKVLLLPDLIDIGVAGSFRENLSNNRVKAPHHFKGVFPAPALTFFHLPIPEVRDLWYKEILGQFQEAVACSSVNSGVLKTLISMGDVKAVFIGHDHLNDFCGNIDGVWLCYGGGFGYHAYGRAGWPRRARIISAELMRGKMEWMGVERIRTWKRLDDEKLTKFDEQVLWSHDK